MIYQTAPLPMTLKVISATGRMNKWNLFDCTKISQKQKVNNMQSNNMRVQEKAQ